MQPHLLVSSFTSTRGLANRAGDDCCTRTDWVLPTGASPGCALGGRLATIPLRSATIAGNGQKACKAPSSRPSPARGTGLWLCSIRMGLQFRGIRRLVLALPRLAAVILPYGGSALEPTERENSRWEFRMVWQFRLRRQPPWGRRGNR